MHGIMTDIAYEQTCFAIQLFQNKNKEPKNLSKYRDIRNCHVTIHSDVKL